MKCRLCNQDFKAITNSHLWRKHNILCKEYKTQFPEEMLCWGNAISGKGKLAWNSGLTKEDDSRIKSLRKGISKYPVKYCEMCGNKCKDYFNRFCSKDCRKMALSLGLIINKGMYSKGCISSKKDKFLEDLYGEDKAAVIRNRQSLSHLGKFNVSHEGIPIHGKVGFRNDLQHFFRSTWEANTARILNYIGIKYEFESRKCRFDVGDLGILILDFYLPKFDIYIEVKGKLQVDCRNKLREFIKLYPEKKVKILDYVGYKILIRKYRSLIPGWER